MYLQIAQIFLASAAMARGEHARCLKFLQRFEDDAVAANAALAPYLGAIRNMRATALEATGDYRKAFEIYQTLNSAERSSAIDPQSYYAGVRFGAGLDIPALPPDPRPPVVQMLGFPRAGTTLLETVIGAHPLSAGRGVRGNPQPERGHGLSAASGGDRRQRRHIRRNFQRSAGAILCAATGAAPEERSQNTARQDATAQRRGGALRQAVSRMALYLLDPPPLRRGA
jgi:hypothetical protein